MEREAARLRDQQPGRAAAAGRGGTPRALHPACDGAGGWSALQRCVTSARVSDSRRRSWMRSTSGSWRGCASAAATWTSTSRVRRHAPSLRKSLDTTLNDTLTCAEETQQQLQAEVRMKDVLHEEAHLRLRQDARSTIELHESLELGRTMRLAGITRADVAAQLGLITVPNAV